MKQLNEEEKNDTKKEDGKWREQEKQMAGKIQTEARRRLERMSFFSKVPSPAQIIT
jgi:hypothetical protein